MREKVWHIGRGAPNVPDFLSYASAAGARIYNLCTFALFRFCLDDDTIYRAADQSIEKGKLELWRKYWAW